MDLAEYTWVSLLLTHLLLKALRLLFVINFFCIRFEFWLEKKGQGLVEHAFHCYYMIRLEGEYSHFTETSECNVSEVMDSIDLFYDCDGK